MHRVILSLICSAFMAFNAARCVADSNQTLTGQLSAITNEIRNLLENDQLLSGNKLQLETPSAEGIDDHLSPFFEKFLRDGLKDLIVESSPLRLKLTYTYTESSTNENKGKRVIQLIPKIFDRGKPIKLSTKEGEVDLQELLKRDVNNTAQIAAALGITSTPLDDEDHKKRIDAVSSAFDAPNFEKRNSSQVHAKGHPGFCLELRRKAKGSGTALPVEVKSQGGNAFAPLEITDTYEVVLVNYDPDHDVVASVLIDGLNVIEAFCTDRDSSGKTIKYPGYFVPRAKNGNPGIHIIPGWLNTVTNRAKEKDNVFEFVVNELGKGAASSLGVKGKTGVVTASFFLACKPGEKPRGRNFGETGKGQPRQQDYELVDVQVETEPSSIVSIRYSQAPK